MSDLHNDFVSLALAGKALTDDIDDFVERWHRNPEGLKLNDYLGMTKAEYSLWLTDPDSLPLILKSRESGRALQNIADNQH